MSEIFDKFKEKAKDVKDAVVDATKDVEEEAKVTTDPSLKTSSSNSSDREYEEGTAGTNRNRQSDPLTEYSDKEPMTPAKINAGEPTAVKRDTSDQKITSEGQTGTSTAEAQEEYRKRGMTKVDSHSHSHEDSSCSCGH
jgi:hypothetical protein